MNHSRKRTEKSIGSIYE